MAEQLSNASTMDRRGQLGFAPRFVSFLSQPDRWYAAVRKRVTNLLPEPAVFHLTHYKAGSQWIFRILKALCGDRFVQSESGCAHFLGRPPRPGGVYPTVYVTREQFEATATPRRSRRFVVIRDLRDTLISGYFSLKTSHTPMSAKISEVREQLPKPVAGRRIANADGEVASGECHNSALVGGDY